jgi:hypothetical protein
MLAPLLVPLPLLLLLALLLLLLTLSRALLPTLALLPLTQSRKLLTLLLPRSKHLACSKKPPQGGFFLSEPHRVYAVNGIFGRIEGAQGVWLEGLRLISYLRMH